MRYLHTHTHTRTENNQKNTENSTKEIITAEDRVYSKWLWTIENVWIIILFRSRSIFVGLCVGWIEHDRNEKYTHQNHILLNSNPNIVSVVDEDEIIISRGSRENGLLYAVHRFVRIHIQILLLINNPMWLLNTVVCAMLNLRSSSFFFFLSFLSSSVKPNTTFRGLCVTHRFSNAIKVCAVSFDLSL